MSRALESVSRRQAVRPVVELLTVRDVQRVLRVSQTTVYGLMRDGLLQYGLIGSHRRVRSDDLQAYIDRITR